MLRTRNEGRCILIKSALPSLSLVAVVFMVEVEVGMSAFYELTAAPPEVGRGGESRKLEVTSNSTYLNRMKIIPSLK